MRSPTRLLPPEDYVHPVIGSREPAARWRAVWPFRLLGILAFVLAAVLVYILIVHLHVTATGDSQG
ncbi:MAG TPA: hypothetical protein VHC41_09425 [Mycobacteriales bacterium]|jgi:hypothetical protein|nr:hypothetical protein [Mycobacteriales bacterium]